MNTFLISLGVALVMALTAALVGPRFVDWNAYRDVAETEGEKLIGRPIAIGGDLEVRILPVPTVRAREVTLADIGGGDPLVSADEVTLSLDLGTLLAGGVEVTDIMLVGSEMRVDRLANGLARTNGVASAGPGPSRQGLRRVEARDATLAFDDPLTGERRAASGVDLEVTTTSVGGPFKVAGHYGTAGAGIDGATRPAFTATFSSMARPGPVKVAARIEFVDLGSVTFDGEISDIARSPRYAGRVRIERPIAAEEGAAGRLTFEAVSDIDAHEAEFSELEITAAEGGRALSLDGSGRVWWAGQPRFSGTLRSRQLDLDAAFGEGGSSAIGREVAAVAGLLAELVSEKGAEGSLQLGIDGMIWRGELSRDIAASMTITPDAVTLSSLSANLPGETETALSGRLDLGDGRFSGRIVAESIEAARLARWIAPGHGAVLADVIAQSRGKLSVRGEVEADADSIQMSAVEGVLDANAFTGTLGIERKGASPRLTARVAFDRFDLDRFLPTGATPADLLQVKGAAGGGRMVPDFAFTATATRMTLFGREAEGVDLAASFSDGSLDIERLAVQVFADSGLNAHGRIEPTPEGLVGEVEAQVSSQSLPRLVEALRLADTTVFGRAVGDELNVDVAELVLSAKAGLPGGGGDASVIALTGDLAGITVEASAGSDAPLPEFAEGTLDLMVTAEAGDARYLFGPNGLYPLLESDEPAGPGRVAISATGRLAEGLEGTAVVDAFGAVINAEGRIVADGGGASGEVTAEIADTGRLARVLGLAPGGLPEGSAMSLSASADLTGPRLVLDPVTAEIAGAPLAATATITRAERPVVEVEFDAHRASLPWIAASVFAPSAGAVREAGDGEASRLAVWPTDLIDVDMLTAAQVTAEGRIGSLQLGGGLELGGATIELALEDGVLTVTRLDGRLAEGEIEVTVKAEGNDHALMVEGRLAARGVPLSEILVDGRGRDLVSGRADIEAEFTARGRSLLSLVSSLEGSGTVSVAEAEVSRFDLAALVDVAQVAEAGAVIDAALIAGRLNETAVFLGPGKLEVANGRIKVGPLDIASSGLSGEATSFIDVPSRRLDQELALEEKTADGIHLALVHAGAFGEISREVEITNMPALGQARWTEPFDEFGVPPPPPPSPSERELPPVGLIDQEVIDLPILENVLPGTASRGPG